MSLLERLGMEDWSHSGEANAREFSAPEFQTVPLPRHAGKSGTVHDIKTSKTGHITITVKQNNGERFKTLAKNVDVLPDVAAW